MFELASVTNALVNVATTIINDLGYPGIFVLLVAGSAGIPVSSEAVMLLAGFDVYTGHFEILAIVIVGVAGDLVGASIAYAIGYFGRIEILHQHGAQDPPHARAPRARRALVRPLRLDRGAGLPHPAAGARLHVVPRRRGADALRPLPRPERARRRAVDHLLGRARPRARLQLPLGRQSNLHYVDIAAVVLIVAGIVYLIVRRRRRRALAA